MIKVGEKYNMLTVKEVLPKGRAIFSCDCGKEKEIRFYNVTRGKHPTKSCGCLKSRLCRERAEDQKGVLTTPYGHSAITMIMKSYRQGAKSRGYEFNLSREQFVDISSKACYYCGELGSLSMKTDCYDYSYNGIDRVDNEIGYEFDNCVPCCKFCNRAKFTYSQEYFIEMCKKVAKENE